MTPMISDKRSGLSAAFLLESKSGSHPLVRIRWHKPVTLNQKLNHQ